MPNSKKIGFLISFLIFATVLIINYEMVFAFLYSRDLKKATIPFKDGHFTKQLAKEDPQKMFNSQIIASNKRINKIFSILVSGILSAFIVFVILQKGLEKLVRKLINNGMGPLKNDFRDLKQEEGNFLTIIFSFIYFTQVIHSAIFSKDMTLERFLVQIIIGIGLYFVVFPLFIFMTYYLFQVFGKRLIITLYISWLLFTFYEFSQVEDVDFDKMKQVDPQVFPNDVQIELQRYYLSHKVFQEIKKTKDKNAALVGYGDKRRIEIYGNFLEENKEGLYAVMLHEIGHAYDNSLIKKILIYIFLIFMEMTILLFLYSTLADNFKSNRFSHFTSFMLLSLVYTLFFRDWLFVLFKIISQRTEKNADTYAKQLGYGKDLGQVLYDIVVEAKEYLAPTFIYNIFRSSHPPINRRVDSLGSDN